MRPRLEIFVVFHRALHPQCYDALTPDECRHLTFVAANETIDKQFDAARFRKVLSEWTLPGYDPRYQREGYGETSVLKHLYESGRIRSEYVGFAQYDMRFEAGAVDGILRALDPETCLAVLPASHRMAFRETCSLHQRRIMPLLQADFELFHRETVDTGKSFPLLDSFVVNAAVYAKAMPWLRRVFDGARSGADGSVGGIMERAFALAIGHFSKRVVRCDITDMHATLKTR